MAAAWCLRIARIRVGDTNTPENLCLVGTIAAHPGLPVHHADSASLVTVGEANRGETPISPAR